MQNQVQIYSTDTAAFYSNNESYLHKLNHKIRSERRKLVEERKKIESEFDKYGISPKEIDGFDHSMVDDDKLDEMIELSEKHKKINEHVLIKNKKAKETKERLLSLLSNKVETNISQDGKHHIRKLDEKNLSDKNVISVFESYFTRTIGAEIDKLCEDFMVIQVFYFDVIKDLIYHGFTYKGEKYIYFTSSAGQIRTKKCVFVKESVWNKYEKTIMCGLTIDDINAKGGNNPNKHLAYLALTNSATDVWEDFDIDKTIVIDDFETEVYGTYDFVDDVNYTINGKQIGEQNEPTYGHKPITHTDGAGMMLPSMGKNRMVRLPWVKGLLGAFDFKKFIEEHGCSPIINDIYGKTHNVIDEDIQVIFTKSQFKMWKYYDSWEDYKEKYKKYNCTAGITNVEEDRIKDATINYQMLQSLTDITDEEIDEITRPSIERLNNICSTEKDIMQTLGITPYNTSLTSFQKAISLYKNLINDDYTKKHIRNIKDSMVKKYKSGKLNVDGKYTFVLPDFYAACQHWFLGEENPDGLLEDGEVFCWLFRKNYKLDCLRSPHLFKEHAIRNNTASNKRLEKKENGKTEEVDNTKERDAIREWFVTDAIYTSCKDLISRILQFDVDGDKLLVVSDKKLIEVAERNMKDVVPLYYDMKKAESAPINNAAIYNGLNAAFSGGNIGIYSNNISKIWNSDVFASKEEDGKENESEKKKAIDIVKLLCMENNFVIDFAKTLYKPERPDDINEQITVFTNEKLPHFFKYAKDKSDGQVLSPNQSFVNKLEAKVSKCNPKISCKKLGIEPIDYTQMVKDKDIDISKEQAIITIYQEFDREYYFSVDSVLTNYDSQYGDKLAKKMFKHRQVTEKIKFAISHADKIMYKISRMCGILNMIVMGVDNKTVIDAKYILDMFRKNKEDLSGIITKDNQYIVNMIIKTFKKKENEDKTNNKNKSLKHISDILNNRISYLVSNFDVIDEEIKNISVQNDEYIADVLVKYLYGVKNTKNKTALWMCYGDYIVCNLENHKYKVATKAIQCIDCGKWFEAKMKANHIYRCAECQNEYENKNNNDKPLIKIVTCCDCGEEFEVGTKDTKTCRCEKCKVKHERELRRIKMQRYRKRKKEK